MLSIKDHRETHDLHKGAWLREFVLGMQDGIVNVLGIVLGVAVGTQSASITILAGLAATFAESISMAAVAYTSSKASADFFKQQWKKESDEIKTKPEAEEEEIRQIYREKGFSGNLLEKVVKTIVSDRKVWLETMMTEELHLAEESHNPTQQAVIVGASAFAGSIVPLFPFFLVTIPILVAVGFSVLCSALLLFAMGAYSGSLTKKSLFKSGLEIAIIGILAAAAGFAVGALLGAPVA
jgi:VIT1/CCC1 family predicted Fe2+/Mn2+ transporter